jgi:PIN domain nuclease of toxin-antitoxin system
MTYLLDTHTFLWFVNDDPLLSNSAKSLIESEVDLLLSVASLWEIAIKVSIGKLGLPESYEMFISKQIAINDIDILPIKLEHLAVVAKLGFHHRDPFDRLIIAQSMVESIGVISIDAAFDSYGVKREW